MFSTSEKTTPVVATFLLLASSCLLYGQIRSATITGSAKDISGAGVAGASVSVTNQDTNIAASAKASETGQFVFPYLQAGRYTVLITAPGFVAFRETGITVDTAQTIRVDATLQVSNI